MVTCVDLMKSTKSAEKVYIYLNLTKVQLNCYKYKLLESFHLGLYIHAWFNAKCIFKSLFINEEIFYHRMEI